MNPDIVLVHGAAHGAWCWELLEPLLRELGHRTVAMDLPIDDPGIGSDGYTDVIIDAMDGIGEDAVLVGHSMAGPLIPRVALRRRVGRLVFLCSLPPPRNQDDRAGMPPDGRAEWSRDERGLLRLPAEPAIRRLYHDCPRAIAERAVARLRPQTSVDTLNIVLEPAFPDVPADAVLCTDDPIVPPSARRVVRDRFGKDAIMLPGGHSPFFSRPSHLARVLHEIAMSPA